MIYIDPPYNKDKDFVYPDRWSEGIKSYKEFCGFVDSEGNITTSVDEAKNATGRKHSRWLTMMYPRLFLARNLLKDDGVIFVSIDDDEAANLKKIMDEIFGEENFVAQVVWQKRTAPDMRTTFSDAQEYILVYGKTTESALTIKKVPLTDEQKNRYKNPDNDTRGEWVSSDYTAKGTRPNQLYGIETPSGKIYFPPSGKCWQNTEDTFKKQLGEGRFYFGANGDAMPRRKNYLCETTGTIPWTWWSNGEVGHSQEGKIEVNQIFNVTEIFSTPKPVRLINRIIQIATDKDSIVLDFFAGAAVTAHAAMALNAKDGGNRKFICVQIPEPTPENSEAKKAGYKTIAEICKERIRRAGEKVKADNPLFAGDIGFKVFKLDESNFKQWDKEITDVESLRKSLLDFADNVVDGADKTDMLYELLLKKGYSLNAKVESRKIADNEIFVVDDSMLVYLDDKISTTTIDEVIKLRPAHFIVLDRAFEGNDQLKTNTWQTFKTLFPNDENPFETV